MASDDDLSLVLPPTSDDRRSGFERRQRRRPDSRDRRGRHRRAGRRALRAVILLLALVVVAGGGYGAYLALRPALSSFTASNDYSGQGTGAVQVSIKPGSSGRSIARVLADADVVKTAAAYVDAAAAEPRSTSIQPGTYDLRKQMSGRAAVTLLLDPASRAARRVVVREGLRATEVVALLAKATNLAPSRYAAALKNPAALGLPPAAKGNVEGWLFPATYSFDVSSTAEQQLAMMVTQTKGQLADAGVADRNAQRVLTIASIAEVEAASPADYAKVARTLDNRLRARMRLQLDSTVSYAAGKRTITTTAAERATRSPYNTYVVAGLPPGPISNPGRAAIAGAVAPTPGPWLYFVTVDPGTGETRFATTAAQHAANVALFRVWCRAHPGTC